MLKKIAHNTGANYWGRIEDYKILKELGRGGFATVYLAECLKTRKKVAIKMIDIKRTKAEQMEKRVTQEVRIHSCLEHPSILKLYSFFQDDKYVYLVLEYCNQGTLQQYAKSHHPLREEEVASIFRQVVKGVIFLHSHQIVHRDLSLANLLLTEKMEVKIADFGLATIMQNPEIKQTTMCGTANFLSPEVATRSAHGLEVDVWSLGCMLYYLLVGEPPFHSNAVKNTITKIVMEDYNKIPDHVSLQAKDLIDKLLRKRPDDRIKLHQILDHPFLKENPEIEDSGLCTMASRPERLCDGEPLLSYSNKIQNMCIVTTQKFSQNVKSLPVQVLSRNHSLVQSCHSCSSQHSWNCPNNVCPTSSHPTHSNVSIEHQSRHKKHGSQHCTPPVTQTSTSCSRVVGSWHQEPIRAEHFSGSSQTVSKTTPCRNSVSYKNGALQHSASCQCSHCWHPETAQHSNHKSCTSQKSQQISIKQEMTPLKKPSSKTKPEKPPCLNSCRLQPTRKRENEAIMSILSSGDIVVEYVKRIEANDYRVMEVCRITSDGMGIAVFKPNGGKGCAIGDCPPEISFQGADSVYSYESLPTKHYIFYTYAYRFVEKTKSVTPKVTVFTDKAKCVLMENSPMPNFTAYFYEGIKIIRSSDKWKCMDKEGNSLDLCDPSIKSLWDHALQSLQHCENLDRSLSHLDRDGLPCFPVVIGVNPRRKQLTTSKENVPISLATPVNRPRASSLSRLTSNVGISTVSNTRSLDRPRVKSAKVPGIGYASYNVSSEVVQVEYPDGSKVSLDSPSKIITYISTTGEQHKYFETDSAPSWLHEHLSAVMRQLSVPSSNINSSQCLR